MTHTWNDAYRWMLEWGGDVERAHTLGLSPVRFSKLEGITALWAEKGSGYDYTLLHLPDAGTVFAQKYVDAGGSICPARGEYGPTLIAPPDGSPVVPKGPFCGATWGWVEPGSKAPDEAGNTPENQDCKPESPMEYSPCQTCVHRSGGVVLWCAIRDADSFFRVFHHGETCSHYYSATTAAPPAPDKKSCTPDLKPGYLKDDAPPTETYWKDLCAKLRRELNEAIEDNEGLRDELLDTLRELRRRAK